jgi:hypothetical protein
MSSQNGTWEKVDDEVQLASNGHNLEEANMEVNMFVILYRHYPSILYRICRTKKMNTVTVKTLIV